MNLQDLKFVCDHAGSGVLPVLSYLHVYDGRAQVGNGRYVVEVPTDLPACTVSADRVVAAFTACKDSQVDVSITDVNLLVKGGRARARIPRSDDGSYPRATPDEKTAHTAPGLASLLRRLLPYVATDASKPWATSVCLAGDHAYATNNVILCRAPFAWDGPTVNLPSSVFDAIIACGEPVDLGVSENSVTFYFEGDKWIKSNLISGSWPTATVDSLADMSEAREWEVPHPDLAMILNTAAKLADARHPVVEFMGDGRLRLLDDAFTADELDPLPLGKVNARMAALVFEHATHVQWHMKPDVHAFRIDDIVGVFGGQR